MTTKRRSRTRRRVHVGAVLLEVVGIVLVTVALGASAGAATQAMTLSPSAELVDGQFIGVAWSGFSAHSYVNVRQCKLGATALSDCTATLTNGVTRANGTGNLNRSVAYGDIRRNVAGTPGPSDPYDAYFFRCDESTPCEISVMPDSQPPSQGVAAQISFAFPPSSCPAPAGSTTAGSGASGVNRAMMRWQAVACRPPNALSIDYTLGSSTTGRQNFISGLSDFAATSTPFLGDELAAATSSDRQFAYVPVSQSGIVLAFNVRDRSTNEQITSLKLTPDLVAELFTGQIFNWNDQRIVALNPGIKFPAQVRAVGRADSSATTFVFTSWLTTVAHASFEAGGAPFKGGPTSTYPSTGAVNLLSGSTAVALGVAIPEGEPGVVGTIGWMDSSTADLYGLPTVSIQNASGQFVVPTRDSIASGVAAMSLNSDNATRTPDFNSPDPAAYPLPLITYVVAPTNQISEDKGAVLASFLAYAVTDGQGTDLPAGYTPLSQPLVDEALAAIAKVPGASEAVQVASSSDAGGGLTDSSSLTSVSSSSDLSGGAGDAGAGASGTSGGGAGVGSSVPSGSGGPNPEAFLDGPELTSNAAHLVLPTLLIVGLLTMLAAPLIELAVWAIRTVRTSPLGYRGLFEPFHKFKVAIWPISQ